MHRAFHRDHANIEDESAPESVAITVDDDKPATRLEYAMHLVHRTRLIWIVMKTVRARDDVKAVIRQRQRFAVCLNELHPRLVKALTLHPGRDHLARDIDSQDLRLLVLIQKSPPKGTRNASNIEHAELPSTASFNLA